MNGNQKADMERLALAVRRARQQAREDLYPCAHPGCTVMRTKAEGGSVFTVCDKHWEQRHDDPLPVTEEEILCDCWDDEPLFMGEDDAI